MANYVTVYTHRDMEICTLSPAKPSELGYIIDHPHFADDEFSLVQAAIDAIDKWLDKE